MLTVVQMSDVLCGEVENAEVRKPNYKRKTTYQCVSVLLTHYYTL